MVRNLLDKSIHHVPNLNNECADTMQEVVEDPRPVSTFGSNFYDDLKDTTNPLIKKLMQKYLFHYNFTLIFKEMSENKVIMVESKLNSLYNIRKLFTDK